MYSLLVRDIFYNGIYNVDFAFLLWIMFSYITHNAIQLVRENFSPLVCPALSPLRLC